MTAQITDIYRFRNTDWSMLGISGTGLFEPDQVGIRPTMMSTACYRGYFCTYDVTETGLFLSNLVVRAEDDASYPAITGIAPCHYNIFGAAEYRLADFQVRFDGGLLLGSDFIDDEYVHMGFQKPHAYRNVREFVFDAGKLRGDIDHSALFVQVRHALRQRLAELSEAAKPPDRAAIGMWIGHCFHVDYKMWGLFRDYERVRAGQLGPYSLPPEEMERLRMEAEESRRQLDKLDEERQKIAAAKEQVARDLFNRIQQGGWTCGHCGTHGIAERNFRLSIGPASCVICRECGWPQE